MPQAPAQQAEATFRTLLVAQEEPAANPSASFGVQVLSLFIRWRQWIDLFIGWQVSSVGERWAAVHGHLALPSGSLASPLAGHRTELALGSAPI